ncbi:hypothetical protein CJU90_4837 [Yarrowia sp. C11]|nr:hypothetical protein CJU90_4837 [Yarrowia sp. C11]KAG5364654.1 hypothetical protein CKK34_3469 [Yarrowia sp. E02]
MVNVLSIASRLAMMTLSYVFGAIQPPLQSIFSTHPDLMGILLVLLIFYVSLLVLKQSLRSFWGMLATFVRMFVLLAVVGAAGWVYVRGVNGTFEDIQAVRNGKMDQFMDGDYQTYKKGFDYSRQLYEEAEKMRGSGYDWKEVIDKVDTAEVAQLWERFTRGF